MEIFKPIPGYEGHFSITSNGTVRREGYTDRAGHRRKAFIVKPFINPGGYPTVLINQRPHYVHRLVLMAWERMPKPGEECRHYNDIKTDNRIDNLSWGSRKENAEDMVRNGHSGSSKTHCRNGHEYTEETVYLQSVRGETKRVCKICRRKADNDRYKRQRETRSKSRSK